MTSKLFDSLTANELTEAMKLLKASRKTYKKGQIIVLPNTKLNAFGLVEQGAVEVLHLDADGDIVFMAKATAGQTFGEALYYLNQFEPIQICALTDTVIVWLSIKDIMERTDKNNLLLGAALIQNFTKILCERSLSLNKRIQVLSKLTLREKILSLLIQNNIQHGQTLDTEMSREELSLYLGTNRSALSRELSRMQAENIITVQGSLIHYN